RFRLRQRQNGNIVHPNGKLSHTIFRGGKPSMKPHLPFLSAAVLMSLVFAAPVRAQAGHGPGQDRGLGLGLKDRACTFGCRVNARLCRTTARTQLEMCATSTCGSEIAAAHQACATDPTSTDCTNAEQAVDTCLQPCLQAFHTSH